MKPEPDWKIDHRGALVSCAKALRKAPTLADAIDILQQTLKANRARCDCGRALTMCTGCAVEDYQAAHPECAICCVKP